MFLVSTVELLKEKNCTIIKHFIRMAEQSWMFRRAKHGH